jgi:hypothetical protein
VSGTKAGEFRRTALGSRRAGWELATNNERVGVGLDALTAGLKGFVESRLQEVYRDRWVQTVSGSFRDDRSRISADGKSVEWDAHSLLTVMWDQWNSVFRHDMGHAERSLVSELREYRNRWAHQQAFDFDDAYRTLDSIRRLLQAAKSPSVAVVNAEKLDLLESYVAEEVNTQLMNTAFHRNKWWVILIYSACCFALVAFIYFYGHGGIAPSIGVIALVFVYLVYQQFKLEPPLLYGPRECPRCHRIIYRRDCPYCASPAR